MAGKKIGREVMEKVGKLKKSIEADGIKVHSIFVYGSYAKGNAHKWSDIDVCVVSKNFGTKIKEPQNYLWSKRVVLHDYSLEPIGFSYKDFRFSNSPLISEVRRTGVNIGDKV
ncbi:nucleotidyltransferase domain-containing protein [Patescibacteria group bacterium]|nr:MAG: nucleotidyltransferase domain-containing protein [Patescibacteria group bacterium]